MTIRDALETCEAFHEFEDLTGMRLSETELEAYAVQADALGVSLCDYFKRGVIRLRRAQEQLAGRRRRMLH